VSYIQRVSAVASIIEARRKLELRPAQTEVEIASVAIGLDGTWRCCDTGWREAMVGNHPLRRTPTHDLYWRNSRVWQSEFLERLEREIGRTKARYPQAYLWISMMEAASNWQFQASYHSTGARFLSCVWLSLQVAVALTPKT